MDECPSFEMPARDRLQVYISERGKIVLKQEDSYRGDDAFVILDPDQVPTVIDWLQQLLTALEEFE